MVVITCLKELEKRGTLQLEDIVEFTIKKEILKHDVRPWFLNLKDITNNEIFKVLNIDKYKLAKKAYGYRACGDGAWPESKTDDFPALTRLVKELYLIIEKPIYTKFTRFEIMEI